jgi:hypothetical protein
MVSKAEQIVADHVRCNVTGLVSQLVEHDAEIGWDLMYGDTESSQLAYDASEVWCVSDWLAGQLRSHSNRVLEVGGQHYWARRTTGQGVERDTVIQRIAGE